MPAAPGSRPGPRPFVQLFARVPPVLKQRVTRLAVKRHCFESEIIEEALEAYLRLHEKPRTRSDVEPGALEINPSTVPAPTAVDGQ